MPAIQIETPVAVHNILFATDFTEASSKAFKYVSALARHFQAQVTAVHVLRASVHDWPKFGTDPEYKKLCHETKQSLDKICHRLQQAGFQADRALLDGDPVEGILKAVKHHKADLLILGTHGSRDIERLMLGSTAEEVLRKISRPVLTVGPNTRDPNRGNVLFRRVILATDFNREALSAALYAFSLAAKEASHISVCHVLPEGHTKTMDSAQLEAEFMQAMNKLIPADIWKKCSADYAVEYGDAADEILALAETRNADLIVLGAHSASAMATHLAPGVAFRVIAGAKCPVLTIRN
jgi:nucleotide-binding universal stress UspA family protein